MRASKATNERMISLKMEFYCKMQRTSLAKGAESCKNNVKKWVECSLMRCTMTQFFLQNKSNWHFTSVVFFLAPGTQLKSFKRSTIQMAFVCLISQQNSSFQLPLSLSFSQCKILPSIYRVWPTVELKFPN